MTYFNEASAMRDEYDEEAAMVARWVKEDFESGAYMGTMKTIEYLGFMLLVPRNTKFIHGDPNGRVYASVAVPVWSTHYNTYGVPDGALYEFICDIGPNAFPYPIVEV